MRQIDIFRKVIRVIQISTVFPKPYTRTPTRTQLNRAKKDNATEEDRMGWNQICNTIRQLFETGDIPQEMMWAILVLIPKTSGGTRGIGLLETMWKVCSSIINRCLQDSIPFHEALHGFRPGRGTGTASLNAKLRMQLVHYAMSYC
jgi:hypothetical protein